MSRLAVSESTPTLEELIPQYAQNKIDLDSYKKICEEENTQIKTMMSDLNVDKYSAGGYVATKSVSVRESINEDKLLVILKKHNITDAIKTKEYVDMDALESYLYNNAMTTELATDLDSCKEKKEVVTLRVKKSK